MNGDYIWMRAMLWDRLSVEVGNEAFLISVWKPLPNRRIWKSWGRQRYVKGHLLAVGLGCCKYYQNQTPSNGQRERLAHKRSGLWVLTSTGEENESFLRVWKPLPNMCFKTVKLVWSITGKNKQYLLVVSLDCCIQKLKILELGNQFLNFCSLPNIEFKVRNYIHT